MKLNEYVNGYFLIFFFVQNMFMNEQKEKKEDRDCFAVYESGNDTNTNIVNLQSKYICRNVRSPDYEQKSII